jgi:hypothetical protein
MALVIRHAKFVATTHFPNVTSALARYDRYQNYEIRANIDGRPSTNIAKYRRPTSRTCTDHSWRRARELDLKFEPATFEHLNPFAMTAIA